LNYQPTDNSYTDLKVRLRIDHLPSKSKIAVLDCFSGHGILWNKIKTIIPNISVTPIEKKSIEREPYLQGDNIKYLKSLTLDKYDIIDLDAYGIPYKQMKILFEKNYNGRVFVTYIQTMFGKLPIKFLEEIGYTKLMIRKCPALFNKNGIGKLKQYLAKNGVTTINYYQIGRKVYLTYKKGE
jgi:hypothetical protein